MCTIYKKRQRRHFKKGVTQKNQENRIEDSINIILKAGKQMIKYVIYSADLRNLNLITIVRKKTIYTALPPRRAQELTTLLEVEMKSGAKNRRIV